MLLAQASFASVASAHPCQPSEGGGPCSVSGTKFNDLNTNGAKDAGEPGLGGWTIYADYDEDGRFDGPGNDGVDGGGPTEPFAISSDSAPTLGQYKINNINCPESLCGNLQEVDVREVQQPGWTCSFPTNCLYDELSFSSQKNLTGKHFGNWTAGPAPGPVPSSGVPTTGPVPVTPSGNPAPPDHPTISAPHGCMGKRFRTTVRGKTIVKVVFSLDGNELKTLTSPDAEGRFSVVTNTRRLSGGVHRLKAKVFRNDTTKVTTLKRAFRRCKATRVKTKFTG